jgi:hypothetical protein
LLSVELHMLSFAIAVAFFMSSTAASIVSLLGKIAFLGLDCYQGRQAMSWKFSDPRDMAVITTWPILRGDDWIGTVYLNVDDGAWQFLGLSGAGDVSEAAVVGLG